MSQLYLVRHGQASFGAENYDQLSDLGFQQALWLGEHFKALGITFDRAITGSLSRQRQTAASILQGNDQILPISTDTGFNEFDFHALAAVYCRLTDTPLPGTEDGGRQFFRMLRRAMTAWARNELHPADPDNNHPPIETWHQFHERVYNAMQSLCASETEECVLVVSSGGSMAMALTQILGCEVETLINLNMQTRNTGIHHLFFNQRGFQMATFNSTPHLLRKDRLHALTYT
jgi:broad specificity phosphatase PhoE